ncbi:MAG: nucleolar RNA-binding Nop10p family protein [Candidatus Nanoarchaeia archaeon]|nr:RNA-protein complex protein Nop10 [Candidatus Haiyanarchaeum thermophilum]MCW1302928.1 RNA-protein complex protein Nop10 [Candidatus Haiyanarchaeum thermophilum]MCW1303605.1 RNA-protein complex protein Nop10 [Candidatus Haiyanarchaeum thermophilum]MCW1306287.1 RNA-protein complex protein Nop10 [Candidatus Haiyanarchaeum thermophilum]MCW1307203.1 RNA-protein complex protein Nop10 [Candidatus Haiyanarchaeum thermophilum]
MKTKILYCENCRIYTLKPICKLCGGKTVERKPMRFSLQDKYLKYRK